MTNLNPIQTKHYLAFLESLKNSSESNDRLLESVASGFSAIYETPDKIEIPSEDLLIEHTEDDAIPFIYLPEKGTFYMDSSLKGQMHMTLIKKVEREEREKNPEKWKDVSDAEITAMLGFIKWLPNRRVEVLGINGRIWTHYRIMSFWKYPSVEMFKIILEKIRQAGVPIDSKWRVEVYSHEGPGSEKLIPVDQYTGQYITSPKKQEELDRLREMHTMSPIDKEKIKKAKLASGTPSESPSIRTPEDLNGRSMAEYNNEKVSGD